MLNNFDNDKMVDRYHKLMKEILDEKLYRHSLGVAEAAASLAEHYEIDVQKAFFAGIVHDYGKHYSSSELIKKAEELDISLDRFTLQEDRLLHAPIGAALLKKELQVTDSEVLRAVTYHTTGRSGMSSLEKMIYLADYIEKGRDFSGVEKIRELAYVNFDQALLEAVEFAIKAVLERKLLLHPRSVAFRNWLLFMLREHNLG